MSNKEGKIFFDESLPIGRIHYKITRKDYEVVDDYFNITKSEDNTLIVKLVKERRKDKDKILISGEVTSGSGAELINAQVEVRIANITKRVNTDISGNYFVEIDLSEVLYETDQIVIEAKQGSCRNKETISFSIKNYLTADIKLDCELVSNDSRNTLSGSTTKNEESIWLGSWITQYESDDTKYILEIRKENETKFIGTYHLDNYRIGTIIFNKIGESLISGFWILRNNGNLENCGEVILKIESPNKFRGYYTELNRTNNDNRFSWMGMK